MSNWRTLLIGFCFFLLSGSTKKSKGGWIVIKASPPVVFVHYAGAACERQRAATHGERAKWKSADGQSWRANIIFSVRVKKEVAQVAFSRLTGGKATAEHLAALKISNERCGAWKNPKPAAAATDRLLCFPMHSRFGWRPKQKLLRFLFFFFLLLYFQRCQFPQEVTGCFNSLLRVPLNPVALRAVAKRQF